MDRSEPAVAVRGHGQVVLQDQCQLLRLGRLGCPRVYPLPVYSSVESLHVHRAHSLFPLESTGDGLRLVIDLSIHIAIDPYFQGGFVSIQFHVVQTLEQSQERFGSVEGQYDDSQIHFVWIDTRLAHRRITFHFRLLRLLPVTWTDYSDEFFLDESRFFRVQVIDEFVLSDQEDNVNPEKDDGHADDHDYRMQPLGQEVPRLLHHSSKPGERAPKFQTYSVYLEKFTPMYGIIIEISNCARKWNFELSQVFLPII